MAEISEELKRIKKVYGEKFMQLCKCNTLSPKKLLKKGKNHG